MSSWLNYKTKNQKTKIRRMNNKNLKVIKIINRKTNFIIFLHFEFYYLIICILEFNFKENLLIN